MTRNSQPIFKSIFTDNWEKLPEVMRKHYANRSYSSDIVVVEGKMNIRFNKMIRFIAPVLSSLGVLVPYEGKEIPTTVRFLSNPENNSLVFERTFHFPRKKPFVFRSKMFPVGGNEMIEFTKSNVGWHCAFVYENGKVKLLHRGYVFRLFGWNIPMPFSFFLGESYAEEIPETKNRFSMLMQITHPLWGKIYEYSGTFTILKISQRGQK